MATKVEKIDVWSGEIRDEASGLAKTLEPLVKAGANFSFVIARREPGTPGAGVVFLGGLKGTKQLKAAESVGLTKTAGIAGLRFETAERSGLVHKITSKLGAQGISLRGVSASVFGSRCALILAFDSASDRDRAARLLRS